MGYPTGKRFPGYLTLFIPRCIVRAGVPNAGPFAPSCRVVPEQTSRCAIRQQPHRDWLEISIVLLRSITCMLLTAHLTALAFHPARSAETLRYRESAKVPVTCPAVELDERQGPVNADTSSCRTQLVVLGTAECCEQDDSLVYEIEVEKILYGSTPDKTLSFHEHFHISGPERQIFALVPKRWEGPTDYELKYHLDVREEKSQRAMSAARLDYHTLAADSIFVGKEIAAESTDNDEHTIEVLRLLHGSEPKPGERHTVEIIDDATVRQEPMLYFFRIENDFLDRKVYRVDTRLPVACEADVVAALKRRDLYPIVDTTEDGRKLRGREVMFRGTVDQAIEFLGSERWGTVHLAARAIMSQKDAALQRLPLAVERELSRRTESAPATYYKQHNLIRLLERLGGGASEGPLARLLENELDYVESRLREPPTSKNPSRARHQNDVDDNLVGETLVWLAIAIDEQVLTQQYGKRLMKLRDAATGDWRAWLQLTLDIARVEDNLELARLAQRGQANPLRSQSRIYHSRGVQSLAFTEDSRFLATGGQWGDIRVWNTDDWTCAQMIEHEGPIGRLTFSSDDKFLSVTSGYVRELVEHRYEWRTGRSIAQPKGLEDEATKTWSRREELPTPDGKYLVTASTEFSAEYFIQLKVLGTTGTGQVVADTRFPSVWDDTLTLAISPDSEQVAVASGDVRLGIYSLPDLKTIREFYFPFRSTRSQRISQLAYSPDGKWLAASQGGRPTPRLFRPETGEEILPYVGHGDYPIDLRFLPDGKTLRSIGNDGTICTWDAATLEMRRRTSIPAGRLPASVCPSDGRYVLCPLARDPKMPIQVFDVETGKALCEVALPLTWSGAGVTDHYAAGVKRVHWLNDQEVLCIGYFIDNTGAGNQWWRFNYRTGEVLSKGTIEVETQNSLLNGLGETTENGKRLLVILGRGKGSWGTLRGEWIDTATLISKKCGEADLDREPNGDFGLVPGGKYFHVGSHIFDRDTLELVAARDFPRDTLTMMAFSPDGSRYAAVIEKARRPEEWPVIDEPEWYRKRATLVRIHETLSGRTLLAFTPSAAVQKLAFSANGRRLATANDDGTIEVWDLPSAPPQ